MSLFTLLLLQIDSTSDLTNAAAPAPEKISLISLLMEGGLLMIPLLICSVLVAYVFVERLLVIRKASVADPTFMSRIREHLTDGNLAAAKSLSKNTQGPVARMIERGINRIGKPIEHIEKSMESVGKLEIYQLEKNMSMLSTIARIAPMFGFLGTIVGMIILFFNIQHQGFEINNLAGGIYTKMVTSASGLIIGLLSYLGYNYLNAQINKNVNKIETASNDLLDILHEPMN